MKFRSLVSVFAVVSLLLLSLSAAIVTAQEPEPPTATETLVGEPAQEATATPTLEVTTVVTPTEEATATPTEEATATPTEEATATPTEGATATPTLEPTATVIPTLEPTATVTPTLEPTATVTPTVEPTATVTPTVVVTPTVTPGASTAGEISAQAIPGSWSSEYIGIQNLGSGVADVVLDLYAQGSSSVSASSSFTLPVNGNKSLSASSISGLSNGAYAGIVTSSEPVAAAVINTNNTGKLGDSYLGFNTPAISQTIPLIFRGHALFYSKFHIQNATDSAQTVTVRTYRAGSSTPAPNPPPTFNIPANTSLTVDFSSTTFNAFGSGNGAYGYAVIEGSGGNIAVVCGNEWDYAGQYIAAYISGVSATAAGQDLVAPLVYNSHALYNTGFNVVNLGSVSTTVTMTYSVSSVYGGGTHIRTYPLGPNQMTSINMAATGIPKPSFGGVFLHSSDTPIVAVVNTTKYYNGGVGFTTAAINPGLAATKMAAPIALQLGTGGAWNTGLTVYNLGGSGDVRATWVRANTNPPQVYVVTKPGTTGSITEFNAAQLVVAGQLPSGFVGSVYIEALGAGSGQRLIGIVNNVRDAQTIGTQILGYLYN